MDEIVNHLVADMGIHASRNWCEFMTHHSKGVKVFTSDHCLREVYKVQERRVSAKAMSIYLPDIGYGRKGIMEYLNTFVKPFTTHMGLSPARRRSKAGRFGEGYWLKVKAKSPKMALFAIGIARYVYQEETYGIAIVAKELMKCGLHWWEAFCAAHSVVNMSTLEHAPIRCGTRMLWDLDKVMQRLQKDNDACVLMWETVFPLPSNTTKRVTFDVDEWLENMETFKQDPHEYLKIWQSAKVNEENTDRSPSSSTRLKYSARAENSTLPF